MAQPFQSGYGPAYPSGSGSYYPNYPPYGNQQRASVPSPFSPQVPAQQNSFQPFNALNATRFNSNAQSPAAQNFSYSTPPFPQPDMYKQFGNPAIIPSTAFAPPPIPFPPPQIRPSYNSTQLPQTSPAASNHPQNSSTHIPNDDADEYDPRYPQGIPRNIRQSTSAYTPVRDTWDRIPSRDAQEHETTSPYAHVQQHPQFAQLNSLQPVQPHQDDGTVPQSQTRTTARTGLDEFLVQEPTPLNDSGDVHGVNTQAFDVGAATASGPSIPSPVGLASVTAPGPDSSQKPEMTSTIPMAQNPSSGLGSTTNKPPNLRHLAKGAILSLMPHNISYKELVSEGIDPDVLKQLFDELGIRLPGEAATSPPKRLEQAAPTIVDHAAGNEQVSMTAMNEMLPSIQAPATAPRESANDAAAVTPAAAAALSAVSNVPTPPSLSPGLERKDRIAQLLAAKTGRPSPIRSASDSAHSVSAMEIDAPALQVSNAVLGAAGDAASKVAQPPQASGGLPLPETTPAAPLASTIPGLFMTSAEASTAADTSTTPGQQAQAPIVFNAAQKRPLEAVAAAPIREPKRQHTLSISNMSDAMVIDSEDDASEGEIVESFTVLPSLSASNDAVQLPPPLQPDTQVHYPRALPNTSATIKPSQDAITSRPPPLGNRPISYGNTTTTPSASSTIQPALKLTSEQIAEKAQALKAKFLKQRAERQKALQEGLPNLDAEVSKTQTRLSQHRATLAQIRQRISSLDLDLADAKKQEEVTLSDLERLEKQLQEGLSGQRQYASELQNLNKEQPSSDHASPASNGRRSDAPSATQELDTDTNVVIQANVDDVLVAPATEEKPIHPAIPRVSSVQDLEQEANPAEPQNARLSAERQQQNNAGAAMEASHVGLPPIADLEDVTEQTNGETRSVFSQVDLGKDNNTARLAIQGDSPLSVHSVEYESDHDEITSAQDEAYRDGESNGSASMSDSGSDDEPDSDDNVAEDGLYPVNIEDNNSEEYDPDRMQVTPFAGQQVAEDEDEEYEPTEQVERVSTPSTRNSEAMVGSPPTSMQPQSPDRDVFHDAESTQFFPAQSQQQIDSSQQPPETEEAVAGPKNKDYAATLAMPEPAPVAQPMLSEGQSRPPSFTPYQSPLSSFQQYRYNPQFNQESKDGFRSLTYSNNIDPKIPLCPNELSGGECQDPQCEEQHFRHLGLSDDKILVQMSSASDIKDKEARDRYILGLKGVIAELRSKGVKEFESVAGALSTYRRDFFTEKEQA